MTWAATSLCVQDLNTFQVLPAFNDDLDALSWYMRIKMSIGAFPSMDRYWEATRPRSAERIKLQLSAIQLTC